MYVLDTNVVSELRKGNKADPKVLNWAKSVTPNDIFISVITVMEIDMGVRKMERRDSLQGKLLREWFEGHVLPTFANRILPVDLHVALQCAQLHVPNAQPERDALIAATALTHRMTVVTRNVGDFKGTGVHLINPWISFS